MTTQSEIVFGSDFLDRHAGQVYQDPIIAAVELIANAWDAGASEVRIRWDTDEGNEISFADDGTGMSRAELELRWRTLHYNRAREQGLNVLYPAGRKGPPRRAYGANGIGPSASLITIESQRRRMGAEPSRPSRAPMARSPFASTTRPTQPAMER